MSFLQVFCKTTVIYLLNLYVVLPEQSLEYLTLRYRNNIKANGMEYEAKTPFVGILAHNKLEKAENHGST